MKTVSVNIENLCVPCHCGCRHCLLCSKHRATGVEYQRGEKFARKFYDWMQENRPELSGMYYVGYCMDFPELPQYINYFIEQTGMTHLMFDGVTIRNARDTEALLRSVQNAGIREIHLTFYGTESYHDRFAGRKGDFSFMIRLAEIALNLGLTVSTGVMVTRENMDQMEPLFVLIQEMGIETPVLILPHAKGRGESISHLRLTDEDFDRLPVHIRSRLPRQKYLTEAQWLEKGEFPQAEGRHLTLSLTPENIDRLEAMEPSAIIQELEDMEDAFYTRLPDVQTLAERYGEKENRQLFRFRDLYLQWQKRFMAEHPIYPDMTDERYSFSTRVFP